MTPENLKRQIEAAFRDVDCPGDSSLADTMDGGEAKRIEDIFGGQRWQLWKDHPSRLWAGKGHIGQTMCFLSDHAFQYYAPLFMLACIFEYQEAAPTLVAEFLLQMCPPKFDLGLQQGYERRMRSFSQKQLNAILQFLVFLKEAHDDNVFGETPSLVTRHVQKFILP